MARPREFDTEIAVQQLADLFWAGGYEATSISDLESKTGLARPRLYAAFGSKRDMLNASIDHYFENQLEMVFGRIEQGGISGISGWFKTAADLCEHKPELARKGCLVVNSLVEFGGHDQAVNEHGERYRARILAAFRSALEEEADKGIPIDDIDQKARLALTLLLGTFVLIRGGADLQTIQKAASAASDLIESWRPV